MHTKHSFINDLYYFEHEQRDYMYEISITQVWVSLQEKKIVNILISLFNRYTGWYT